MPATDKPMLTKAEVKRMKTLAEAEGYGHAVVHFNTIEAAVELLERQNNAYGKCLDASDWYIEHYPLVEDIEAFLAAYHSTTAESNANKGDV